METNQTHMLQVGEINSNKVLYFEDYAHTYLKKQEPDSDCKYFLYGRKEREEEKENIYIYGLSKIPKLEKTYFKEYSSLGFLRTKEEKLFLNMKGREEVLEGYYIFYDANQAMQDYLVESIFSEEKQECEKEVIKPRKQVEQKPIHEVNVSRPIFPGGKKQKASFKPVVLLGAVIAGLTVVAVSKIDHREERIEVFKEIVGQVVNFSPSLRENYEEKNETGEEFAEDEIIIENKEYTGNPVSQETEFTAGIITAEDGGEAIDIVQTGENAPYNSETGSFDLEKSMEESSVVTAEENQKEENQEEEILIEKAETEKEIKEKTAEGAEEEMDLEENEKEESIVQGSKKENENEAEKQKEETEEKNILENEVVKRIEHIVKEGETLIGICQNYYGSLDNLKEILSINDIENEDFISPGQKIYLPE